MRRSDGVHEHAFCTDVGVNVEVVDDEELRGRGACRHADVVCGEVLLEQDVDRDSAGAQGRGGAGAGGDVLCADGGGS